LIANSRGITHHEVVRRAVVAYVAACFTDPDGAEILVSEPDGEPDLAASQRRKTAFEAEKADAAPASRAIFPAFA
jgi:hypothetical protein